MSGRASSLLVVVITLSGVGPVLYLLELKALRVGLNLVPLPLSVWSAPQEVIAEANEARGYREDLSTSCVCIRGSTRNQTQAVNLPLLHSSQIWCKGVAWSGGGGGGAGRCDVAAARIEVAALPTDTRALSLEVFSQNPSVPDSSLSCHVGWAHRDILAGRHCSCVL